MSSEERLKILKMIADGILSIDEAEQLLDVLEERQAEDSKTAAQGDPMDFRDGKAKWLRVKVTDQGTGKSKVNVRVPASLISAGMKMGSKFVPELQGIDSAEILSAVNQNVHGKFVDVMDDETGEHIEIMIE
jgi:hypothetical protein